MRRITEAIDLPDVIAFVGIVSLGVGVAGVASIWAALIVVGIVMLAAVAWGAR